MYLLLRVNTRRRWQDDERLKHSLQDDAPPDLVNDFRIQNSALSVYLIDEERTRVTQVAVALAATRDNFQQFDYILFDENIIEELGLGRNATPGEVPDTMVAQWHIDLTFKSLARLCALIVRVWHETDQYRMGRVESYEIKAGIESAYREGRLLKERINKKLLQKLESSSS